VAGFEVAAVEEAAGADDSAGLAEENTGAAVAVETLVKIAPWFRSGSLWGSGCGRIGTRNQPVRIKELITAVPRR